MVEFDLNFDCISPVSGQMSLYQTDNSFTFNKNDFSLTIDKEHLKAVEHEETSINQTAQLVCENVHGVIGVVNIHAYNYLVIATDSYKTCTVPAYICGGNADTDIYALTKVQLVPF